MSPEDSKRVMNRIDQEISRIDAIIDHKQKQRSNLKAVIEQLGEEKWKYIELKDEIGDYAKRSSQGHEATEK